MIYFLRRADGDIKIGTTIDFKMRLVPLESKYGKLELLGVVDGGVAEEKQLHVQFAAFRRCRTEWFQPAETTRQYIEQEATLDIPKGKGVHARIAVSKEVACDLRAVAQGLGVNQDQAIKFLVRQFTQGGDLHAVASQYRQAEEAAGDHSVRSR